MNLKTLAALLAFLFFAGCTSMKKPTPDQIETAVAKAMREAGAQLPLTGPVLLEKLQLVSETPESYPNASEVLQAEGTVILVTPEGTLKFVGYETFLDGKVLGQEYDVSIRRGAVRGLTEALRTRL